MASRKYEDEKVEEESTEARGFAVKDYQYDYQRSQEENAKLKAQIQYLMEEGNQNIIKLRMLDAYRMVVRDVLKGLKDA